MSGISYGAAIGGQLIGVDDRVEAALLLLGDGGVVERFTDENGEPTWEIAGLSEVERQAWFEAMLPIEPSRYIGDSEAKILFMNGFDGSADSAGRGRAVPFFGATGVRGVLDGHRSRHLVPGLRVPQPLAGRTRRT